MAINSSSRVSPTFSVIIPTHNRPRLLRACVESVLAQSLAPERFEILVVDDGSRTPAERVLRDIPGSGRVRVLRQAQQGWARARQLGAEHARGEILVFLDDDCRAPTTWLEAYARVYAAHPATDGVGGALRPGQQMNIAGCKQYQGHLDYFRALNREAGMHANPTTFGRVAFTFGGNRSFHREIWWEAQASSAAAVPGAWYFDDTEIDLRLRELGACVRYSPEAWVSHHYALSVGQRIRAAFRYGRSEVASAAGTPYAALLPQPPPARSLGERWRRLGERWRRLAAECPSATILERLWYALTQPLVWLARRAGQWAQRRSEHVAQ